MGRGASRPSFWHAKGTGKIRTFHDKAELTNLAYLSAGSFAVHFTHYRKDAPPLALTLPGAL